MKLKPVSFFLLALTGQCLLISRSAADEVGEGDVQVSVQLRSFHGHLTIVKLRFLLCFYFPSVEMV